MVVSISTIRVLITFNSGRVCSCENVGIRPFLLTVQTSLTLGSFSPWPDLSGPRVRIAFCVSHLRCSPLIFIVGNFAILYSQVNVG